MAAKNETKRGLLVAPGAALKEHFGFSAFLDGQEEVISEIVSGRDGLVVMPTGWVLVIDGMNRVQLCLRSERVLLSGSLGFYSRMARFLFDDGYSLTNDSAIRVPPSAFAAGISKSSSKILL